MLQLGHSLETWAVNSQGGSHALQELKPEYIENQKAVDAALAKQLTEELSGYLKARFTLRNGDRPHLMKF